MELEIVVTRRGPCTVVAVSGVVVPGTVAAAVPTLAGATGFGRTVVVTLDGLEHACPDGLRALTAVLGAAQRPHLTFVVRRNSILAAVVQARLHHVVDVYPVLSDAMAGVQRATRPVLPPPARDVSRTTRWPWAGAPGSPWPVRAPRFLWHGRSERSK